MFLIPCLKPGEQPWVDDQGYGNTCTRSSLAKAITGGLDDGTFGPHLDVSQSDVTSALLNKDQDVAGRWPQEYDGENILGMDRNTKRYHNISPTITKCRFGELMKHWNDSKFVVVNPTPNGLHCLYVEKVVDGKLVCVNSYGSMDPSPKLKPKNVKAIYRVRATATPAPTQEQMTPQEKKIASLEQRNKELEEQMAMLLKMNQKNQMNAEQTRMTKTVKPVEEKKVPVWKKLTRKLFS